MRMRRLLVSLTVVAAALVVPSVAMTFCEELASGASAPTRIESPSPAPARRSESSAEWELLRRYAPVLRYDREERFPAVSPAALAEHPDATLRRSGEEGELIAAADGTPERLSLDFLGAERYENGQVTDENDTLGASSAYSFWADQGEYLGKQADVTHARAVRGEDGRLNLTYWNYHVYNNAIPCWGAGWTSHDSDWEVIYVRMSADERTPELVIVSQHKGSEPRLWRAVEKVGDHPVIYPARGTHAGAFSPGCHWAHSPVRDCNDGRGRLVLPELHDLNAGWASWPGRWGTIAAPCTRWDTVPGGPGGEERIRARGGRCREAAGSLPDSDAKGKPASARSASPSGRDRSASARTSRPAPARTSRSATKSPPTGGRKRTASTSGPAPRVPQPTVLRPPTVPRPPAVRTGR